jgi:arylsulfatase
MLLNYTATLAWDIDFVETLFKGQVRGEFTDAEKAQLGDGQSLDGYACYRGIHDGRYKFARYFKPAEHHQPEDWGTLLAHNELELYDTAADQDEVNNLANQAENHQDLILDLNVRLNKLIDTEIGIDDGSFYSRRRNFSLQT